MKFIEPSVTEIKQESCLSGMYKMIEIAARVCHQSKPGNVTLGKFITMLISKGHMRPLEFGTVYLEILKSQLDYPEFRKEIDFYKTNPYSVVNEIDGNYYITTNYRVIVENKRDRDLYYFVDPIPGKHTYRVCMNFVTERAIGDEIRTHVSLSHCMESMRMCNYSKDKFGNELTFIKPIYWNESDIDNVDTPTGAYLYSCEDTESKYLHMSEIGMTPQQIRLISTMGMKCQLISTGFVGIDNTGWNQFMKNRNDSVTVDPELYRLIPTIQDILKSYN